MTGKWILGEKRVPKDEGGVVESRGASKGNEGRWEERELPEGKGQCSRENGGLVGISLGE